MKRLLRRLAMLYPSYRKMFFLERDVKTLRAELQEFRREVVRQLGTAHGEVRQTLDDLFKNDIRCRWQVLDALDAVLYPPTTPVSCLVCGYTASKASYATRTSQCIFGGGRLERFVCPDCGCVFGPLKMLSLSQEQLGDEYAQSYSVYSESQVEFLERKAFDGLIPVKGGSYLNYGAGAWNQTTEHLRDEGFDVYDYEPYAPVDAKPWVIRSEKALLERKFDGVFSNSLIEHLRHPVDDLRRMKTMLKPGGRMSHGTGCYEYAYEYTRFHLAFFVGDSLARLSELAGLKFELSERFFSPDAPERICVFEPVE